MSKRQKRTALAIVALASVALTAWIGINQATSGSFNATAGNPPVGVTPVELPDVFLRPQSALEQQAAMHAPIATAVAVLVANDDVREDWKPGKPIGGLRILADHLGASDRQIFAFRTTRGKLCAGLTGFTSGCFAMLPTREGITMTYGDPDAEGAGAGTIIWGLTASRVSSVSAIVNGRQQPAVLGDHAYFFQVADPSLPASALQDVVVGYRNGTHQDVVVPTGPQIPVPFG